MPSPRRTERWRPTRTSARSSSTCRLPVAHELDLTPEVVRDPRIDLRRELDPGVVGRTVLALLPSEVHRHVDAEAVEHLRQVVGQPLVAPDEVDRHRVVDRVEVPRAEVEA